MPISLCMHACIQTIIECLNFEFCVIMNVLANDHSLMASSKVHDSA